MIVIQDLGTIYIVYSYGKQYLGKIHIGTFFLASPADSISGVVKFPWAPKRGLPVPCVLALLL